MNETWFNIVEIEINTSCNRKCNYCPNYFFPKKEKKHMNEDKFLNILFELKKIDFDGRLSYHFYNEPLLHPKLKKLVELANDILPKANQVIFTNGDLLTDKLYEKLIQAGVFHFFVTSHDSKAIIKRKHQNVLLPNDLIMTNRGGIIPQLTINNALKKPCLAPSEMLVVTINGDIIICYEDYHKKYVMGNIFSSPIEKIWFSPVFKKVRSLLSIGKRSESFKICKKCSSVNHQHLQDLNELIKLGQTF